MQDKIEYYVTCIDKNGNIGMYDIIENKFLGNKGTGAFIAVPTV